MNNSLIDEITNIPEFNLDENLPLFDTQNSYNLECNNQQKEEIYEESNTPFVDMLCSNTENLYYKPIPDDVSSEIYSEDFEEDIPEDIEEDIPEDIPTNILLHQGASLTINPEASINAKITAIGPAWTYNSNVEKPAGEELVGLSLIHI